MAQYFHINVDYKVRQRSLLNSILAIATGILTVIYPNFLYLIAGGYLLVLGIMMVYYKMPPLIAAFPIVAGILIFLLPELIPYTFAAFLGFFGLIFLFAFQFMIMGFLTLIIAILTILNPEWVAYFIAIFLLIYGVSELIQYIQERNRGTRAIY